MSSVDILLQLIPGNRLQYNQLSQTLENCIVWFLKVEAAERPQCK